MQHWPNIRVQHSEPVPFRLAAVAVVAAGADDDVVRVLAAAAYNHYYLANRPVIVLGILLNIVAWTIDCVDDDIPMNSLIRMTLDSFDPTNIAN